MRGAGLISAPPIMRREETFEKLGKIGRFAKVLRDVSTQRIGDPNE